VKSVRLCVPEASTLKGGKLRAATAKVINKYFDKRNNKLVAQGDNPWFRQQLVHLKSKFQRDQAKSSNDRYDFVT
jgi:hypothetical protein